MFRTVSLVSVQVRSSVSSLVARVPGWLVVPRPDAASYRRHRRTGTRGTRPERNLNAFVNVDDEPPTRVTAGFLSVARGVAADTKQTRIRP